ncbi:NAD(P)/FAD-dependent oxidoreductase [Citricoccus nitrophenolicus]|uniref:NAD(P)/FAD-dependent oxidoreductase n=1 Tax=Citricoccus nitrophenolicus TaxID=863575 RepID=UPI0031F1362D
MNGRTIIVGASVATTAFLERLRESGYREHVTVVDGDLDAPYDRPPLSKQYLKDGELEDIMADWGDLDAQIVRAEAVSVDSGNRLLHLRDVVTDAASTMTFDRLVLACGASPARLPFEPQDTLVLRHANESRALRDQVSGSTTVTIIGAGAIGVELASSLRALGAEVTVLDRAAGPLERLLGGQLQDEVTGWLDEAGVITRWGVGISRVEHVADGWEVEIDGGEIVRSDLVVSAVGSKPAIGWLQDSGLLSGNALLVDAVGQVLMEGTPVDGLYAIGDVASRQDGTGNITRTESWSAAREQGERLADHLLGREPEAPVVPYFWTEVAGRKLQVLGRLDPAGTVDVDYSDPARGTILYRVDNGDAADAWIGVNAQPRIAQLMMSVAA